MGACEKFFAYSTKYADTGYDRGTNTFLGLPLGPTLASVALPGELYNGPDVGDGLDSDGFPGGDRRFNHYPTTRESALQALLDFIPKDERSEVEDLLRDVLDTVESEEKE